MGLSFDVYQCFPHVSALYCCAHVWFWTKRNNFFTGMMGKIIHNNLPYWDVDVHSSVWDPVHIPLGYCANLLSYCSWVA